MNGSQAYALMIALITRAIVVLVGCYNDPRAIQRESWFGGPESNLGKIIACYAEVGTAIPLTPLTDMKTRHIRLHSGTALQKADTTIPLIARLAAQRHSPDSPDWLGTLCPDGCMPCNTKTQPQKEIRRLWVFKIGRFLDWKSSVSMDCGPVQACRK